jgi:sulfur-carrier protein
MASVAFTQNIQRLIACPEVRMPGRTVREVLEALFAERTALRSYVLDDQGAVRKHMAVFVDGGVLRDRDRLSDPVSESSEIVIMQALSGG